MEAFMIVRIHVATRIFSPVWNDIKKSDNIGPKSITRNRNFTQQYAQNHGNWPKTETTSFSNDTTAVSRGRRPNFQNHLLKKLMVISSYHPCDFRMRRHFICLAQLTVTTAWFGVKKIQQISSYEDSWKLVFMQSKSIRWKILKIESQMPYKAYHKQPLKCVEGNHTQVGKMRGSEWTTPWIFANMIQQL